MTEKKYFSVKNLKPKCRKYNLFFHGKPHLVLKQTSKPTHR